MTISTMKTSHDQVIRGGSPTIFVSDFPRAIRFYTESLGLTVLFRADDHFAMLDAGDGLQVGLHPTSEHGPRPGTNGATQLGLNVTGSIADAVASLTKRGVTFDGPIIDDGAVKLAFFCDPDGNQHYLCEVKQG